MTKIEAGRYREITENYTILLTDTNQFNYYSTKQGWKIQFLDKNNKEVESFSRETFKKAKSAIALTLRLKELNREVR